MWAIWRAPDTAPHFGHTLNLCGIAIKIASRFGDALSAISTPLAAILVSGMPSKQQSLTPELADNDKESNAFPTFPTRKTIKYPLLLQRAIYCSKPANHSA